MAVNAGAVTVTLSSRQPESLDPEQVLRFDARERGRVATTNQSKSWLMVTLAGHGAQPTHYTLRHHRDSSDTLRNWRLEGSTDGQHWEVMKEHKNDRALQSQSNDHTHTWPVACSRPFSRFRIIVTDKNSSSSHVLALCGMELWGPVSASWSSGLPTAVPTNVFGVLEVLTADAKKLAAVRQALNGLTLKHDGEVLKPRCTSIVLRAFSALLEEQPAAPAVQQYLLHQLLAGDAATGVRRLSAAARAALSDIYRSHSSENAPMAVREAEAMINRRPPSAPAGGSLLGEAADAALAAARANGLTLDHFLTLIEHGVNGSLPAAAVVTWLSGTLRKVFASWC